MTRRPAATCALAAAAVLMSATCDFTLAAQPANPTTTNAAPELGAPEPTTAELLEQIKQLQTKVEQLQSKQEQQQSTTDVADTVQKIVADAEQRSTLFTQKDASILAGHEKGKFFLRSGDGNFLLNPGVQFQFRYVANDTQDAEPGGDDVGETGFEIRRAKFNFAGHLFTPKLTYNFQWETNQQGGAVTLEDAWVRYQIDEARGWYVGGGQFKDPTFHEELTSSRRQLAVDRSLLNELFGGGDTDYMQGVYGLYDRGDGTPLRAMFGYTDGIDSINTNFRDTPVNDTDWGAFARADFFAAGTRKMYDDFTAMGNKEDLLVAGAGVNFSQSGDEDVIYHTLDLQWENDSGLSAYGAYLGQWNDGDADSSYNWGLLAQVGYLFKPKWEVFGRYDVTFFEDEIAFDSGNSNDMFQEFTVGMNHYIEGHSAKFTLDVLYLPEGSPTNETGIGVLAAEGEELILRAQFQLLL